MCPNVNFLLQEVRVEKPAHELNIVEVQTAVSNAELRLLTRGKLALSIASKNKPMELRLEGKVITRATCEIFQVTCVTEIKLH
jgi:hypothetical protein